MGTTVRIYADFNSTDETGRVWGLLEADLENQRHLLADGLKVILHMDEGFEIVGTLVFENNSWLAIPDWTTLRDAEH